MHGLLHLSMGKEHRRLSPIFHVDKPIAIAMSANRSDQQT
jgi:hypothetical protein